MTMLHFQVPAREVPVAGATGVKQLWNCWLMSPLRTDSR